VSQEEIEAGRIGTEIMEPSFCERDPKWRKNTKSAREKEYMKAKALAKKDAQREGTVTPRTPSRRQTRQRGKRGDNLARHPVLVNELPSARVWYSSRYR